MDGKFWEILLSGIFMIIAGIFLILDGATATHGPLMTYLGGGGLILAGFLCFVAIALESLDDILRRFR